MNFLEQLAAEWYSYSGYFVRTNIKTNKRVKGGWGNEVDVLAFSPKDSNAIHLESSWDSFSWEMRKSRFTGKKFVYSHAEYEKFVGCKIVKVTKIALCSLNKGAKTDLNWGNEIEVVFIPQFIADISSVLENKDPARDIVPEGFPCLRAMQFALAFGKKTKIENILKAISPSRLKP